MTVLITGGTGFLGANLAKELVALGNRVVLFDVCVHQKNIALIEQNVKVVQGDLACFSEVLDVVKKNKVKKIYHCGALLSHSAEDAPLKAYEVNMLGTWYVLEAARLFDVEKVLFTSTVATFGPQAPDPTPNIAPQLPTTLYGVCKVASERLGEYYQLKYGLDFRGVRFPSIIGPGRGPGGVSAYSSLMIEKPLLGLMYTVCVEPRCRIPLLYIKDAVNALMALEKAEGQRLNHRMYNVNGFSPSAEEIAAEVEKLQPDPHLRFEADPEMVRVVDSWPNVLEDREAKEDWGWQAQYDLEKTVKDFFEVLSS